ncbi:iron-dicitrate transporter permease subunit [Gallibacterium salpingitidis]|uniref:Iron-dicitrate transporter permease subunit n=1 Tax=Gallibacterium salpingitidis TaxID=505341 RepID=A0A1A7QBQ5_9PAST|nr:iron-dicitrate ABC transporter permease FecC [Gallibacterium salpingitidis]OBW91875.1 iron-dicitrate transporter permease subunit [Gallibacterium salpingitidis]OBX09797.1 iron-dicitrate transporter permease subunit [Gallibacterium salpingitidis]OBX11322.1 iron-dicitrate transporter permease subunit [Gallibacterium salpingitidis]WKS99241.1 iron-dicitrate ABC transporter permease FecC [Gallibacterium salpingitidis]
MRSVLLRWLCPILVLLLLFWGSLFLYYPLNISANDALYTLFTNAHNSIASITVNNLRVPRSICAMLIGASLSLAGALLQSITRNPLASPSLLGINSGAALAMVIATAFNPALLSSYSISFVAALGGGLSWLLVISISAGWRTNVERSRIVLAGIAVSMLCAALTKLTLILSEDNAYGIMNWLAGGVGHIRWEAVKILLPFTLPAIIISMIMANKLNILSLSDETATSLGINLFQLRIIVNLCALFLIGSTVSIAGPFAFIGLLVPHIARYWIGHDLRKSLPMSIIFGAILMLIADTLARAITFPNELPAGAILALIGAPFFVWLARGKQ